MSAFPTDPVALSAVMIVRAWWLPLLSFHVRCWGNAGRFISRQLVVLSSSTVGPSAEVVVSVLVFARMVVAVGAMLHDAPSGFRGLSAFPTEPVGLPFFLVYQA